jgi:hypothetical protein
LLYLLCSESDVKETKGIPTGLASAKA